MTGLVDLTVRPLDGDDILAVAVRESRAVVVPDSRLDPRCDPAAVASVGNPRPDRGAAGERSSAGDSSGRLASPLDPSRADLRPLETLASHTARALTGLRQLEEIRRLNQTLELHAQELARSELALREQTRILQSVLDCMGDGVVVADSHARFLVFNPAAERILGPRPDRMPRSRSGRAIYEVFLPDRTTPYPGGRPSLDPCDSRRVGRPGRALHRLSQPR